MSESILQQISTQFKTVSSEEWISKITKDLKGELFEKLISYTEDEIEILPFYTAVTTEKYHLAIPEKQTKNWFISEKISVSDISKANTESLHALENGSNCILFDLQNHSLSAIEIQQLINGILLDIVPVYFLNYISSNKIDLENGIPNSCVNTIKIDQQKSTVNELVTALQNGIQQNQQPLFFHFYIGQNYFLEIAKFRAFRWLWQQLSNLQNSNSSIFILAETGNSSREANGNENEIYTNILRNTTEAMAAIIGGCDYLVINSHDVKTDNSNFGKRIARNVQHILQQESYFNDFNDIAKGSFYVEYLTYQLAEKAWKKLQNLLCKKNIFIFFHFTIALLVYLV